MCKHNSEHLVITLMLYIKNEKIVIFRLYLVIFSLMLIVMIIIGVVITRQNLFINEWIGFYFPTLGKNQFKGTRVQYKIFFRAAETILTLAYLSGKPGSAWIGDREVGLERQLSDARKALALFQHHDGITGTAKEHVVVDYGKKY